MALVNYVHSMLYSIVLLYPSILISFINVDAANIYINVSIFQHYMYT